MSDVRRLGRRPALDGIRGIAVLLVLFFHGGYDHVPGGFLGVDVFFVLSGFLITTLLFEEWGRQGTISLKAFYARRARRLLPGLVILVLLGWLVEYLYADLRGTQPYWVGAVGSVLYINNLLMVHDGASLKTLSPTWTLAIEDQFYLLWPAAVLFLLRRRATPARLLAVCGGVIVASVTFTIVVSRVNPGQSVYMASLPRAAELAFGAALSILWRERMLPRVLWSKAVGLVALAGVLLLGFTMDIKNHDWLYARGLLYLPALCTGVLLVAAVQSPRSPAGRILTLRVLRYTGKISYGMYLFNLVTVYLVNSDRLGIPDWSVVGLRVIGTYAAAMLSWYLVESRFLRRSRRLAPVPAGERTAARKTPRAAVSSPEAVAADTGGAR